jgi:chemotaxis protein CheC
MLNQNENNLDENVILYQMDAMREMGNIAAAHAATALSKLLAEEILIDVSESHLYLVEDLPNGINIMADRVAVVYIDVYLDQRSIILFVFPYDQAIRLSNMFLQKSTEKQENMDENDQAAICEIGNILACAYLNAISKFLGITLIPSPPGLAVDMLGAILEFPASIIADKSDLALVIESKFIYDNEAFPGLILFMMEPKSQELILNKFRVNPKTG